MNCKNINDFYNKMNDVNSLPILDSDNIDDVHNRSIVKFHKGSENMIYSLSDSISTILWKNLPDSKVAISVNFSPPIIINYDQWKKSGMTYKHRHDFIEIAYVVNGEFHQIISNEKHFFSQGSVFILDRNSEHCDYVRNQDNFVVFICIKDNFFDELFLSELVDGNVQQFFRKILLKQKLSKQFLQFNVRNGNDMIYPLIDMITIEQSENKKGSNYLVKGLLIRIFDILYNNYDINISENAINEMNDMIFLEVDDYLRNHFKDASLKALAEKFHFQEDYFSRMIKKHTGDTYTEHLRKIRIGKADELLLNTNMSVCSIIDSVGYDNRHHFYNLFYNIHKMTPEQFRKSYNSNFKDFYNDDMTINFTFKPR